VNSAVVIAPMARLLSLIELIVLASVSSGETCGDRAGVVTSRPTRSRNNRQIGESTIARRESERLGTGSIAPFSLGCTPLTAQLCGRVTSSQPAVLLWLRSNVPGIFARCQAA